MDCDEQGCVPPEQDPRGLGFCRSNGRAKRFRVDVEFYACSRRWRVREASCLVRPFCMLTRPYLDILPPAVPGFSLLALCADPDCAIHGCPPSTLACEGEGTCYEHRCEYEPKPFNTRCYGTMAGEFHNACGVCRLVM